MVQCAVLGSYRREVEFSSDIDLVIRHKKVKGDDSELSKEYLQEVVASLERRGLITKKNQLTFGAKKYSVSTEVLNDRAANDPKSPFIQGLAQLPGHRFRRIDIRLAPWDAYPYMQLGSTGDSLLMKLLRHTAKLKGFALNEYGMGESFKKEDANPNGFREDTLVKVTGERGIFKELGLPYLEPKDRDYSIWKSTYLKAGADYFV